MVVEIVNVGSMWAKQCQSNTFFSLFYAKAGLHSFTQHLAMELADYNIRVNAVSPAVVNYIVSRRFWRKRSSRKGTED
jgi:NAD(P)-dependent dehydrogenase (short-subunit alcohol dehydrogenase family)